MRANLDFDQSILIQFNQGDERALAVLFDHHFRSLCYHADSLINNSLEAEDIVTVAFTKLWERRAEFTSYAGIKGFLSTVVRNACFDFQAQQKKEHRREKELILLTPQFDEVSVNLGVEADLMDIIYKQIDKLPFQTGKVFKMRFLEMKSYEAIAGELGISPRTARNLKTRAVDILKKNLFKDDALVSISLLVALANILTLTILLTLLFRTFPF